MIISSDDALARDLDAMVDLGLTDLRIDVDWWRIEAVQGQFDWSSTDRIISAARRRGITVHALLTYTPPWARPAGTDGKHPPTDPADFAAFSRAAVQRYSSQGVNSWEIWNEPNLPNFWSQAGGPDPARYAELLTQSAAAIRSADTDAVVISGGLAPATDSAGVSMAPETFLTEMFKNLDRGIIDAVAIHPYSFPALPTGGENWNTFSRLPDFRRIAETAEGRQIPIWLTEFGAPTGTSNSSVSPARQETLTRDALECLTGLDWVGPVFLYNMRDRAGGDAAEPEDNFGLFTADWQEKPVVETVRRYGNNAALFAASPRCPDW